LFEELLEKPSVRLLQVMLKADFLSHQLSEDILHVFLDD